MNNTVLESGYGLIQVSDTRGGHIDQSLLSKENFQHYTAVAEFLSKSTLVPKGMIGKPADLLIAMECGLQLGIPMMQAIQDIAVINGRPALYGDGLLAVVQGHKDYEWMKETVINEVATCVIKRKNHEPHTVTFSKDDAKKAALWGKAGPWSQYPERMLRMRARGFCIRDLFSDALRGIKTDEEVQDYPKESNKSSASQALLNAMANNKLKEPESNNKIQIFCSASQQEHIEALLATKVFSKERFEVAMKYYEANTIIELTEEQANHFIKILSKEPDKE